MLAAGVAALALAAAGCASNGSSAPTVTGTPITGGTAVWAEPPASVPTYIFPFVSSANISNINLFDLQYQMYRPLYWFGVGEWPRAYPVAWRAMAAATFTTRLFL